jgi:hypothetical protein
VILSNTVAAICLGATICIAQTIELIGSIKDISGVGISGATVKLERQVYQQRQRLMEDSPLQIDQLQYSLD